MELSKEKIEQLTQKYPTPFYLYDFDEIANNGKTIMQAFRSEYFSTEVFFAMKANCHPAIVKLLSQQNLGMDCVSPGELEVALKCGVKKENILYTGNYESMTDLTAAYEAGIKINLDDINSFFRLKRIGVPEFISFRINPGKGRGKYKKITTGGSSAKFGIPFEKAGKAYKIAKDSGVKRFGAHMMVGSGILDENHFTEMLELFMDQLKTISTSVGITFDFIDMGGGLGIPYQESEKKLDIYSLGKKIQDIFQKKVKQNNLGNPALGLEPGRFLVGNGGYLVTKVLGIKESYKKFIGVDAGFNTLIRPALYGATHNIFVPGKENEVEKQLVNVCGQICENSDIFGEDISLPIVKEGDFLVITQAGAYGNVMSMPYNLRLRPAEVAIQEGKDFQITRAENMQDYWQRIIL